jgi:hypothetical protein
MKNLIYRLKDKINRIFTGAVIQENKVCITPPMKDIPITRVTCQPRYVGKTRVVDRTEPRRVVVIDATGQKRTVLTKQPGMVYDTRRNNGGCKSGKCGINRPLKQAKKNPEQ